MNTAQKKARARVEADAGRVAEAAKTPCPTNSAASILRLAVTALSMEKFGEWLSKPTALAARRFIASLPAPICNLAWTGLPTAQEYNRLLMAEYHSEGEQ